MLPTFIQITLTHKDDPAAPWEFVSNSLPPTSQVIEEHARRLALPNLK